jgi:class 3 adenylate cyclase
MSGMGTDTRAFDMARMSPSSGLAAYLTRKGASLDSSIQWGSPVYDEEEVKKRKQCSIEFLASKRPKMVEDFNAKPSIHANSYTSRFDCINPCSDRDFVLASPSSVERDRIVPSIWSFIASHNSVEDHDFDFDDSANQRWMAAEVEEMQHMQGNRRSANAMVPEDYMMSVSGSLSSITSTAPSMKLRTYTVPTATVLCIDIKGFTAGCAAMDAGRVGEWVAEFYERVDIAAAAHGVSKVEVRGDCCICVAGVAGVVPSPLFVDAAADPAHDQTTRMLNFAAALHADLASLTYVVDGAGAGQAHAMATATRMGVATGEIAVLISDPGDGAGGFASMLGETMSMAAKMESLAESGAALLHELAAERWAAEGAGRAAPPTVCVEVEGHGPQRAAVFHCAAGAFCPAEPAAVESTPPRSPRRPAESGRRRRAASAPP